MPYIDKETREIYDKHIKAITNFYWDSPHLNPGELNYVITSILELTRLKSYASYNDAMGILSCVSQEMYRKTIAPYEDIKIGENGDINRG